MESTVALIRGLFGFDGPVGMLAAARRAAELETDGNTRWYGVANTALGPLATSRVISARPSTFFLGALTARQRLPSSASWHFQSWR